MAEGTTFESICSSSPMDCDTTSSLLSESGESLSDENIGVVVNIFRPLILDTVIATDLLGFMPDVPKDEKKKIIGLNKRESHKAATEELLQFIESKEDELGKWRSFLDALENTDDYPYVTNVLKGEILECEDTKTQQRIIAVFAKQIERILNPKEVTTDLVRERLINDADRQEIESEYNNHGPSAACMTLIDRIPRRQTKWYRPFLTILDDNDYGHLVQLIDPDIYNELQGQHLPELEDSPIKKIKLSEDAAMFGNVVTVQGSKQESSKNETVPQKMHVSHDIEELAENTFENLDHDNLMPGISQQSPLTNDPEITMEKEVIFSSNPATDHLSSTLNQLNVNRQVSTSSLTDEEKELMLNNNKQTNTKLLFETAMENINKELGNNVSHDAVEIHEMVDSDESSGPKLPLELRSYQQELAYPALAGNNVVIVAPTGSGKTHVAMKIIQDHIEKMKDRRIAKVIFLVEQNALAMQQCDQIKNHLDYLVKGITGETQRVEQLESLATWLDKRDILVVTAQLLVNALVSGDVKITDFSLMVFDECHHTTSKHPYNQIMQRYMDTKYGENAETVSLPQIVGLTASVGVGKAKNVETAVNWIKKVMANLDAKQLSTVKSNKEELSNYSSIPQEEVEKVRRRETDFFGQALRKIMTNIETYMRLSPHTKELPGAEKTLAAPAEKGVDQYNNWISSFQRESAKIHDQHARRFFVTCRYYLEAYHKTLMVYADARVKDALDFLEEEFRKWDANSKSDETDKKMKSFYEKSMELLMACMTDPKHDNPKLLALRKMVIKAHRNNEDMRGIVFVKTRDLVTAIASWMNETPGLSELKPVKFVGAQASSDKGGMTKSDQDNVLKYFREGKHKIIIATSVAEEGLDIRKCNLVIRYDHVTNEIAMVQSRGRGRAEHSKYVVLAEEGGKTAAKEEINIIRENMMNKAIIKLQEECGKNPEKFLKDQETLQREAKIQRDLEAQSRDGRIMVEGEFTLLCNRCHQYICMTSDVRKIQRVDHAVVHPDIKKHVKITKQPATFESKEITCGIGKLNCLECKNDLGNVAVYKNVQFPLIKIASLVVEDIFYNKNEYKKWNKVPFSVRDLSHNDLQRLADAEKLVED